MSSLDLFSPCPGSTSRFRRNGVGSWIARDLCQCRRASINAGCCFGCFRPPCALGQRGRAHRQLWWSPDVPEGIRSLGRFQQSSLLDRECWIFPRKMIQCSFGLYMSQVESTCLSCLWRLFRWSWATADFGRSHRDHSKDPDSHALWLRRAGLDDWGAKGCWAEVWLCLSTGRAGLPSSGLTFRMWLAWLAVDGKGETWKWRRHCLWDSEGALHSLASEV